ncbi:MAG: di-heme oxidoredictase family protein [Planctomycetota bacterium]|jgi:hypothetical protein
MFRRALFAIALLALIPSLAQAQLLGRSTPPASASPTMPSGYMTVPPGTGPALGFDRITQDQIVSGELSEKAIRKAGMRMFSTPFNRFDGYGDGPVDISDPTSPGGRPTLQGNGTFLRVNGLDSQTCMECHSVGSNATVPFTFAVGGAGGSNNNAMFGTRDIDVDDSNGWGFAFFNGRYINPPFLFGAGGVELLAKEMTADLQDIALAAQQSPGLALPLVTKGVDFGEIVYDDVLGTFDTSAVVGVDTDLVVRPFGRKGDNQSVRQFDLGALAFHLGMQPVEVVGAGVDADNDGVADEALIGELSALHVFGVTMKKPRVTEGYPPQVAAGQQTFQAVGCAGCHVPALETESELLGLAFPEVPTDPSANIYMQVNLTHSSKFSSNGQGGVTVPLFSDLKRHDMGPQLGESFGHPLDDQFITPRLWGIADTAPYLHDGRALTLTDAILSHGGEGQAARDAFAELAPADVINLLAFLDTLKTPKNPNKELLH